jgi:hypothetical protein
MSTPEVAEIATKRKDELAAQYADVLTAMQETRAAMDSYSGDMKTIRQSHRRGADAGCTKAARHAGQGGQGKGDDVEDSYRDDVREARSGQPHLHEALIASQTTPPATRRIQ